MSESTAEVTRAELPSAPKPKAKKGLNIAVSSCSRSKQKPLFEEDTTDAMDLFGSMGLGSAMDAALRSDKDKHKASSLFSTSKHTSTQSSRLTATTDVGEDDGSDEGGWGDDDGWNDSDDDILSD